MTVLEWLRFITTIKSEYSIMYTDKHFQPEINW